MAWTGEIVSITKNAGGLDCTLVYRVTDGTSIQTITEPHVSSTSSFQKIVQDAMDVRNGADAAKAAIAAFDPTSLVGILPPPPIPIPPTKSELDARAFQVLLEDYQIALNAETIGISVTPDSATSRSALIAAFKPEYRLMLLRRP